RHGGTMRIGFVLAFAFACKPPPADVGPTGDRAAKPGANTKPEPAAKPATPASTATPSSPSSAVPVNIEAAKAANIRGLKLQQQKKYVAAITEYRQAIAEDPGYVLAHYNLACAASLAKDMHTTSEELTWVADRASWDPVAKSARAKAQTDRDLEW